MSNSIQGPSSAPARRRGGKWLFIFVLLLVAVAAAAVFLAPVLTDAVVRPKVVEALRQSLNGEPAIRRLSYSFFRGLEVEGIQIGNPPGFSAGACISVDRATAEPHLLALAQGRVILQNELRVVNPRILIEQNAKGELNLQRLPKEAAAGKKDDGQMPLIVASVLVEGLDIRVKTPALAQPVALSPIHLESRVEALDRPIAFTVKNADGSLDVKGNAQIAQEGKLDLAKLKAELDYAISPALLAPLKPALGSLGPVKRFEGTLAGSGRVTFDGLARPAGKGQLTLDVPELAVEMSRAGTNVVQTLRPGATQLAYEFKARGERQSDIDLSLTSPALTLALKGVATADPAAPSLDGEMNLAMDVATLAERFPGLLATGRKLQGRIAGSFKNLKSSTKSFEADMDIRGEGLAEIGPDGAPRPLVKDLSSKLHLVMDLEKNGCRFENFDTRVDEVLTAQGSLMLEKRDAGAAFEANVKMAADLDGLMSRARRFTPCSACFSG